LSNSDSAIGYAGSALMFNSCIVRKLIGWIKEIVVEWYYKKWKNVNLVGDWFRIYMDLFVVC
jgi:hypothetical protein